MALIQELEPGLNLNYNKFYIGLADQTRSKNFVMFRAKRTFLRIEARTASQEEWLNRMDEAGVATLRGGKKRSRISFQIRSEELEPNKELLKELFAACYKEFQER